MEHAEASLLLVDYIRGELGEERRRAVAAHLQEHPECAETVRFLEQLDADLARYRDRLLGSHPAADVLVAYAVGPAAESTGDDLEGVAEHVASCAQCFADLQVVRRIHAELVTDPQPAGARRRWPWLPVGTALAAGLVLGVLRPWDPGRGAGSATWEGPVPVVRLVGSLRDGSAPRFAIPAGAPAIPLVLAWDPWTLPGATGATTFTVRVLDAVSGRERWRLETTIDAAWDPAGAAVSLLAPARALGGGERLVVVEGPGGDEAFSAPVFLSLR